MRSRRLPISSTLRDRTFPGLHVSGEMLFPAREYKPEGYSGLVCALAAEIKPARTEQPPFCQDASGHEFVAGSCSVQRAQSPLLRVEGTDEVTTTRMPQCDATNGGYFVCPFNLCPFNLSLQPPRWKPRRQNKFIVNDHRSLSSRTPASKSDVDSANFGAGEEARYRWRLSGLVSATDRKSVV